MAGVVANPETISTADNTNVPNDLFGKAGERITADLHGKYYTSAYRGEVFGFAVNAATLPVNAATLASKFSVVNPLNSTKVLELIRFDWAYAVATTVVNGIGIYTSTAAQTALATLTTPATAQSLSLGPGIGAVAVPYSALTASGTPAQVALVGYTGAVTSTAADVNQYNFDGAILIWPGYSVHVAMTVAASTGSGFSGFLTWAEHPV